MNRQELQTLADSILRTGPDRVLIDREGIAVSSRRAREEFSVMPDVIFIRDDGWSLGASARLESAARALWEDEWVGLIHRPATEVILIEKGKIDMLILARKISEQIEINAAGLEGPIVITVTDIRGGWNPVVRLGFAAPLSVTIMRTNAIKQEPPESRRDKS